MKKCIVIGSGFAGLSTAVFLAGEGFKVEIIEASQKPGGRAYSFLEKKSNITVDNGQHILMGCYRETLNFLRIIEALDNLEFQKNLKVNFLKENFQLFPLKASGSFYPLNLLTGLINYKAISLANRFRLLKFFLKMHFYSDEELKKISLHQWLLLENQNEEIRKAFWEILAAGALNTDSSKASAKIFSDILKEIFFRGNSAAAIILPKVGLTETYCTKAVDYIRKNGGKINYSEQLVSFEKNEDKIISLRTSRRIIEDFDFVVSALPLYALKKITDEAEIYNEIELEYSTILSIHLWLKNNPLEKTFYGLINSEVHWIFNHNTHLTIVISNADKFSEMSKEEICTMISGEIERFTPIKKSDIVSSKIIKEKRSTFIPSNDIIDQRPFAKTKYRNLFLAGDWINTGLPSTIESAVKSGKLASEAILSLKN